VFTWVESPSDDGVDDTPPTSGELSVTTIYLKMSTKMTWRVFTFLGQTFAFFIFGYIFSTNFEECGRNIEPYNWWCWITAVLISGSHFRELFADYPSMKGSLYSLSAIARNLNGGGTVDFTIKLDDGHATAEKKAEINIQNIESGNAKSSSKTVSVNQSDFKWAIGMAYVGEFVVPLALLVTVPPLLAFSPNGNDFLSNAMGFAFIATIDNIPEEVYTYTVHAPQVLPDGSAASTNLDVDTLAGADDGKDNIILNGTVLTFSDVNTHGTDGSVHRHIDNKEFGGFEGDHE
jgi:hypothetical protein